MSRVVLLFLLISTGIYAQTGIGTTTPVNKLEVVTTTADPASSGIAANGNLRLGATSTNVHVLDFGLSSTSTFSWLQARSKSAYGTTYNLSLNPIGGNVGIGTTNPTAKLNLVGGGIRIHDGFSNSTSRPALTSSTIGAYEIRGVGSGGGTSQADGGDDGFLRLSAGGGSSTGQQSSIDLTGYSNVPDMLNNIVMRTEGTERLRINNAGNVGIGTTAPSVRLQVSGDIIANSIAGSSDLRFKTNVRSISSPLEKVKSLRGVYFNWDQKSFPNKDFSDKTELGFIAQEVEKVLPEVVSKDNSSEEYRSVKYDKVVALLVEAIKEQQKQIDSLKSQVKKLKRKKK
jgi:hypothetical protein